MEREVFDELNKLKAQKDNIYKNEKKLDKTIIRFLKDAMSDMEDIVNSRNKFETQQRMISSMCGLAFENEPIEKRYRKYDDAILLLKKFVDFKF